MAQRGKKKIDTWEVNKDGRTVGVDVYMSRETSAGSYNDGGLKPAVFVAECKELNLTHRNANIDELQTGIIAEIKKLLSLEYSPYFVVEVDGKAWPEASELRDQNPGFGELHADAKIKIARILLSEKQSPGGRLQKNHENGSPRDFNENVGPQKYSYGPKMTALIPDTAESRAGLRRIVEAFADLNKRLVEVCNHERIEKNLLIIGAPGGNLLTAGKGE